MDSLYIGYACLLLGAVLCVVGIGLIVRGVL